MFQIFDFWHDYIPVCMVSRFSHVRLFATPWTVACQAPLEPGVGFRALLHLPCPGIEPGPPVSSAWQADSLPLSHQGSRFAIQQNQNNIVSKAAIR